MTEFSFEDLLGLMNEAFRDARLPSSLNAAKNMIGDLGLDYQKLHVFPNSCMLYCVENKI